MVLPIFLKITQVGLQCQVCSVNDFRIDMNKYVIRQSSLGGGGYITGLVQHPHNPLTLYARCDVAGVFKSEDGAKSWRMINNGMTQCHDHSVRSLAISPHNPNQLLRGSGEARDDRVFGTIHKTTNGGENWREVCADVDYYGNGPTRMFGELIEFDPADPQCVISGGYSTGVWTSFDEGETWQYSGLRGERITSVRFHPLLKNMIYVGTVSDIVVAIPGKPLQSQLARFQDFARGEGKLFRSVDRGKTWELLHTGLDVVEIAFDTHDPERLYMATVKQGILGSTDGGRTWNRKSVGLPDHVGYRTITVAPTEKMILYTAPDRRGHPDHIPQIPIYRSANRGDTWEPLKWHTTDDIGNYPDYMTLDRVGWAISKILVDHADPNRLYLCNWYGVSTSPDNGQTWDGGNFMGIETTCAENIVSDPTTPNRVYFTLADHHPSMSTDGGKSYHALPRTKINLQSSTALVASQHHPGLVIYGMTNWEQRAGRGCALIRSEETGKIPEVVHEFAQGSFVQALAEDPRKPGTFYAYIEGSIADGSGLYKSEDWGNTWLNLGIALPDHIRTLPHQKHWIEAKLLSVVVYQVKNVCGTNQLLCVDPHVDDVVYLGEWTEGIYKITDGGQTVTNLGTPELPFGRHKASVLTSIRADPKRPGVLYAGFIREGLWQSQDYGAFWQKMFPQTDQIFNASAVAIGGPTGNQIVVASEPLYWSQCKSAVWFSPDAGTSWQAIYDGTLGALRWKGIAIDNHTGTVHGCTCGNGCFNFSAND